MMELSDKDIRQLHEKGISEEVLQRQIKTFKEGIPFIKLEAPAIVGDGILRFSTTKQQELVDHFDNQADQLKLEKFVPASGAASRMFKALFNFLDAYDAGTESLSKYLDRTADKEMKYFFDHLREFAFFDLVEGRIRGEATSKDEEYYLFVNELLSEEGLNYGFYPKGLLPFHKYKDQLATPFEEHLMEGATYCRSDNTSYLHFTISPQHGKLFNEEFSKSRDRVTKKTNSSFEVTYSYQKPSTDTLAVTPDNVPFREEDGTILFRPGGHGALIENLNDVHADVVFIKNIDNVTVQDQLGPTAEWKKILGGYLLELREKLYEFAALLEEGKPGTEELAKIKNFLEDRVNIRFTENFDSNSISQQIDILKDKINRPLRICGMVKNEGQPGGGPFFIRDSSDHVSLQIVESAQVDLDDPSQKEIFMQSTHFNPVDIVCSLKNYKGEKYNLLNFVDKNQGFITSKTNEGKELKALELPGLWNGGMAFWNTVFVEVPIFTFNPVKTVNDLLNPAHQA